MNKTDIRRVPGTLTACIAAALLQGCVAGPRPVAPRPDIAEMNRRLGRGMNLGNALEAPREGEWGFTIRDEYFDLIRGAGFDSVRIPVRWSAHAAEDPPYPIDPVFLARVDHVVTQALARGLAVVLNIHHYEELMKDPEGQKARFLSLWEQIATHVANFPDNLYLEVLNEPSGNLSAAKWNEHLSEALRVIRRTNPSRPVVVGTADWGGTAGLAKLVLPPADSNLIVTVHYYAPFHFTHQGASWVSGSDAWMGTTWKETAEEKAAVAQNFEEMAAWSECHATPLYIGEFGAYKRADEASRVRWTSFVAREAERRDFPWAYWEFGSGFGVYHPAGKNWDRPLLNALVPGNEPPDHPDGNR